MPALHRSFKQQPLAQLTELQSAEPPPLPPPPELLLAAELALLLPALPPPDVEDALVELLSVVLPVPPDPVSAGAPPFPPKLSSNSLPAAQAASISVNDKNQSEFFIWAPWALRRC